jgi:glycosyltransferase involved in cell wall biosynthesis
MRILSLSQLLMPDSVGGTGRVARSLADALVARGDTVTALSQRIADSLPAKELVCQLEIVRFGSPRARRAVGVSASAAIGINRPLRRLLRDARFDAAIGHQPMSSLSAARLLRDAAIPELRIFHAPGALETERRFAPSGPAHLEWAPARRVKVAALWRLERAYVRGADRLCFLSAYMKRLAERLYGEDLPPSTIIPGGVDLERFRLAEDRKLLRRQLLGSQPDGTVLFTARNLAPRMGLDALLEAMPEIIRHDSTLRLFIAGSGALDGSLRRHAARLGVSGSVTFLGRVSDDDLIKWHQASDVFILPTSEMEGFGMVTIEALACGTPVIGTPVGATPEILVHLERRLIARGATPPDLAAAVIQLLSSGDLGALRVRARAHAEAHYDVRLQASRIASALSDLSHDTRRCLH